MAVPPMTEPRTSPRAALILLSVISLVGLAVRLFAARAVGFGDSEALYASYALFPAPAYLDHPGLIGMFARGIAYAHGLAPTPTAAHVVTACTMTLAPWVMALACRLVGAAARPSLLAALAVAAAPEVAIGLFGMTPDLPLFFAWVLALAAFGRALLSTPGSTSAATCFMTAGLCLGVACASKVSGLTLLLAWLVTLASPTARAHARTLWPWAAVVLALVVFSPVLLFEAHAGWPMVHHRLVETQHDAGVSLRNAIAVALGQLAYVSPGLAVLGVLLARQLLARRRDDVIVALLAASVFFPLAVLGVLCLWSRVAEPHWLAPAWLALPMFFAVRSGRIPPRLGAGSIAFGLLSSAFVYAWVLDPGLVARVPPGSYDARLDIANELYGWREVAADVRHTVERDRMRLNDDAEVVVVGSVWMVSAQLRAALPRTIAVGCAGREQADFAVWNPPSLWSEAEVVVFVHDNRAPQDSSVLFPDRSVLRAHTVTIKRGGQTARVFTVEELALRAAG